MKFKKSSVYLLSWKYISKFDAQFFPQGPIELYTKETVKQETIMSGIEEWVFYWVYLYVPNRLTIRNNDLELLKGFSQFFPGVGYLPGIYLVFTRPFSLFLPGNYLGVFTRVNAYRANPGCSAKQLLYAGTLSTI